MIAVLHEQEGRIERCEIPSPIDGGIDQKRLQLLGTSLEGHLHGRFEHETEKSRTEKTVGTGTGFQMRTSTFSLRRTSLTVVLNAAVLLADGELGFRIVPRVGDVAHARLEMLRSHHEMIEPAERERDEQEESDQVSVNLDRTLRAPRMHSFHVLLDLLLGGRGGDRRLIVRENLYGMKTCFRFCVCDR